MRRSAICSVRRRERPRAQRPRAGRLVDPVVCAYRDSLIRVIAPVPGARRPVGARGTRLVDGCWRWRV
jgi:hypothetical protein